jgi:hypothetical protein
MRLQEPPGAAGLWESTRRRESAAWGCSGPHINVEMDIAAGSDAEEAVLKESLGLRDAKRGCNRDGLRAADPHCASSA